jgi:hypothetical protein
MLAGTVGVRLSRLVMLVVAAALASAVSGCSSGSDAGPLSSGNGVHDPIPSGSICVPGGRPQTFGDQQFTNYGHITVVLDRVVLLRPRNERLIGAYAVPGDQVIGTAPWPPEYPHMPPGWKDRRPVPGFRLAPGQPVNIVLGVVAVTAGRRAISQGMLVYYHDSSGSYVAPNYFANIIAASTRTCN